MLLPLCGSALADTLAFTSATQTTAESSGSVAVTVSRTGTGSGAATVQYATSNGSALAGSDYTPATGTLNWNDGDLADKTISITLPDDQIVEGTETFTIALANPTGATLGTPTIATITLSDVEPGHIAFTANAYTVSEDAGTATITVSRSGGTTGAVSVTYSTSPDSAASDVDYTDTSGTLSWADGEGGNKSFTVAIVNDDEIEERESLQLHLSNFSDPATGSAQDAPLYIDNADIAVQFSRESISGNEGDEWIWLTVDRLGGGNGQVTVQYSVTAGTAEAVSDYLADSATGTLTWPNGVTAPETIYLHLVDDDLAEPNETLTITLATPSGATLGDTPSITVTIVNDDTDFSSLLTTITPELEGVTQPPAVDLSADSPLTADTSIIDEINGLTVVSEGRFLFAQDTASGQLSSPVASDSLLVLHPVRVETPLSGEGPGLHLSDAGEVRIVTDDGLAVVCLPASGDLAALYDTVSDLGLAEVAVNAHGDLSIPLNSGAAPLVPNDQGELVIPPSWFLRYVARPALYAPLAESGTARGIAVATHPTLHGFYQLIHRFTVENRLREQILYPALADWDAVVTALSHVPGFQRIVQDSEGVLKITLGGTTLATIPDYLVDRYDPLDSDQVQFAPHADLNGDGTADYLILYPNGDQQALYVLP
ncbi:Calx-beta domain-containing protein [Endothiovibrio diazotrophicus]